MVVTAALAAGSAGGVAVATAAPAMAASTCKTSIESALEAQTTELQLIAAHNASQAILANQAVIGGLGTSVLACAAQGEAVLVPLNSATGSYISSVTDLVNGGHWTLATIAADEAQLVTLTAYNATL
jgi:hypothetical protein